MIKFKYPLTLFLFLSLSFYGYGQDSIIKHTWYIPNHAVLQYAGDVGMFSAGIGFQSKKEHFQYQFTVGYVPKAYVDKKHTLVTLNTLLNYSPLFFNLEEINVRVSPIVISLGGSYSFGEQFTKFHDSNYPQGYYWWPKSARIICSFGHAGRIDLSKYLNHIDAIELFSQFTTNDLALYSYSENTIVKFKHIFHYSCGMKVYF
ncbi:MAG: hypothetical protein RBR35_00900 [Salinivirgaceae bacterium]|nr:hypothetical protein [Salinivirgaceae bacterium]